jgi:hypothetical protein
MSDVTRDHTRNSGRRALPALILVALLAGCSQPDTSPIPNTLPTPDASSSPDRSLPPAKGKWAGLGAKCPKLESAAARALGVTGEGRPTPEYITNGAGVTADCRWGSDDGHGMAVKLRMSIYPSQTGADAQWRVLSAGKTEKLSGVGDEAFSSLEPSDVAVWVRSNNVVATVRIVPPSASASHDRLQQQRPAAGEITSDMLDDLR